MSATITLLLTALLGLFGPNKHPMLNNIQSQTTVQADVTVDPTVTPTDTPSVTPSVTPTDTPTVTPSVTPSVSPSPSPDKEPEGFGHGKKKGFFNGLPFGFFVREMAHMKNEVKHEGDNDSDSN